MNNIYPPHVDTGHVPGLNYSTHARNLPAKMLPASLNRLASSIGTTNFDKGWRDRWALVQDDTEGQVDHVLSKLALVTSEVAEAIEEVRTCGSLSWMLLAEVDDDGKPTGLATELADILIRTLDIADMLRLDIEGAVARKLAYNETRPAKHGKVA